MGMSVNQKHTSTGVKGPVLMDWVPGGFATVGVWTDGAIYGVEYTLDDVNDPSATVRWFSDPAMPAGTSVSKTTTYDFPVRSVRINITVLSGSILEFKVLQSSD